MCSDPIQLQQSTHLHWLPQKVSAAKHSQYFRRHADFLQWHPSSTFFSLSNADGFLERTIEIEACRLPVSVSFSQPLHVQPSQSLRAAKHSQYSFRHLDFTQRHHERFPFMEEGFLGLLRLCDGALCTTDVAVRSQDSNMPFNCDRGRLAEGRPTRCVLPYFEVGTTSANVGGTAAATVVPVALPPMPGARAALACVYAGATYGAASYGGDGLGAVGGFGACASTLGSALRVARARGSHLLHSK